MLFMLISLVIVVASAESGTTLSTDIAVSALMLDCEILPWRTPQEQL